MPKEEYKWSYQHSHLVYERKDQRHIDNQQYTMEGYLKKWTNPFLQWQQRYFILHDDCLIYSDVRGGQKKGTIHLKIAEVMQVPDDPFRIIIDSGTRQLEVRAENVESKIKWFNSLKEAQIKAQASDQFQDIDDNFNPKHKSLLLGTNQQKIEKLLVEAFEAGAKFEETISDILPKLVKNPQLCEAVDKLQNEAYLIKSNLKDCLLSLENERKRLYRAAQVLSNDSDVRDMENRMAYCGKDDEELRYFDIEERNDTMFDSIVDDGYFYKEQQSSAIMLDLQDKRDNPRKESDHQIISNASLVSYFTKHSPIKLRLLTTNPAYLASEVADEPYRLALPKEKDPNEKINIWSIVKDSIGKDLSKFAVPVYLNEPTSMLQRLAEQMEYSETLDAANATDDLGLAMSYVMGFAVSIYAGTINRTKKPFNPLLGETYELVDTKKGYRFISEQVSHHPPISAGIADSNNYVFWGDSNIKSQFWGKSFEVHPLGNNHIQLKRLKHDYIFKKCTTSVKNIIIGQIFIDHFGTMEFKNYSTGVYGELNLKEKGMWSDKGQYEIEGWVKNKENKVLYTLFGHWNAGLAATNVDTKVKTEVWKRNPLPPRSDVYYQFTGFSFQLNHLYKDLMKKIAPTDTRLRPDQRALEYGLLEIAAEEKLRLEQKQRMQRKENEMQNKQHQIVFFEEKIDSITGEKEYQYKGGYWEARERGDWQNLGLLDIY